MAHERIAGRIQRLMDARKKFVDRLEANSKHERASMWKRKIGEYDVSLANFQKYGQEKPPTGNLVSVNIDVPKHTFEIKGMVPGTEG